MKMLVTGAGGFVAHHFLQHVLTETDWDVIATDSFRHKGKTDRIALLLDWKPEWRERVTVITHDLNAPFSEQMIHRIGDVDFLVALASESHVDRSITDPVPFVQNNVNVMLYTLELARKLLPRAVLVVSTDEVYGPLVSRPHLEWHPLIPSNPYSASKAAQEAIAVSYWRTYGVPVMISNSVNVYGERQDPEKYLPLLIKTVISGGTVKIHGNPDNVGSRYYIHARNVSDAWLFLLQNVTPGLFPEVLRPARYNIAGSERVSNLEFAETVAEICGVHKQRLEYELVDFHHARPGHDPHYGLDTGKITRLGWKQPIDFYESLCRTVGWTLAHREWLL